MFKNRASKIPDFGGIETWGTGVRKWLLLNRPEGIDSWLVHPLFYICALSALVLKVRGILALHDSSPWLALIYFSSGGLFGSLAFYLRRVSQRLKVVGNGGRKVESSAKSLAMVTRIETSRRHSAA
jgi:hypothetical protein